MAESGSAEAPSHSPSLGSVIPLVTGFLALAGGIAYAIMRYSYGEYYDVFGLTPDDVGPDSAVALTQSAVGAATFVALFAILPVTLALLGAFGVDRAIRGSPGSVQRPQTSTRLRLLARLVLAVLVSLSIYRAFTALTDGHWEAKQLGILGVGVGLVMVKRLADEATAPIQPDHAVAADEATAAASADQLECGAGQKASIAQTTPGVLLRIGQRLPTARWIVAALMILVGALVLGGSLPDDARATAHCAIERRQPVRFVHTHRTLPLLEHIGVLRVRADPAVLAWIDSSSKEALPNRPLVYLGERGGRYFVYSIARGQTIQIPDGAVVLSTIPRSHCHYWQPAPGSAP